MKPSLAAKLLVARVSPTEAETNSKATKKSELKISRRKTVFGSSPSMTLTTTTEETTTTRRKSSMQADAGTPWGVTLKPITVVEKERRSSTIIETPEEIAEAMNKLESNNNELKPKSILRKPDLNMRRFSTATCMMSNNPKVHKSSKFVSHLPHHKNDTFY